MACVRVQARDPDALANVRIARWSVCPPVRRLPGGPHDLDARAEQARVGREPTCEPVAPSVALQTVLLRSRSRESGARDTASGLGYTRFFFLRTTVLQHELFFSQYEL